MELITSLFAHIKQQPHDSFLGTKPDGNGAIGNGVPASDGYASWDGAYPRVSGHIHQYDSFNPTQIQVEHFQKLSSIFPSSFPLFFFFCLGFIF